MPYVRQVEEEISSLPFKPVVKKLNSSIFNSPRSRPKMTKNHELKVKAREDAKSAFEIEERDRLRHYTPMKSGRKKVKHFNKPSPSKYCKVKHQNTKVVTISVTPSYRDSSKNETKSMHSSHIG